MKVLIEKSKYLSLIAVVTLLITFALALLWGVANAVSAWVVILTSYGKSADISLLLIKLVDAFLLAIVLYLLAASIYKLFIGDVELPSRLVARNLPELKSKLSGIMVLVIAVRFVEDLFEGGVPPEEVFWLALATTLVTGMLIAFGYFGNRNEGEEEQDKPG
jgi:uncharacterized membrane protein YqhA